VLYPLSYQAVPAASLRIQAHSRTTHIHPPVFPSVPKHHPSERHVTISAGREAYSQSL
jgi:hypothetical protein